MKELWEKYAQRIDSLSLRERVFLLTSVMVVVLAVADTVWLSPAQTAQRQLVQRFGAQAQEMDQLRAQLQVSGQVPDAGAQLRNEIAAANARLDAVNRDIAQASQQDTAGLGLERVLVQFLRREEGLTLVSTTTLPLTAPTATAAAVDAISGATAGTQPPGAQLRRRGLELRIAGPYAALTRYVQTLEAAMPLLRWGPMQLRATKERTELTLQVYLVEVQP